VVVDILEGRQPVEMTAETLSRAERALLCASTRVCAYSAELVQRAGDGIEGPRTGRAASHSKFGSVIPRSPQEMATGPLSQIDS